MTYEESSSLMQDGAFQQRIKVAVLQLADYIHGEDPTTPAHNTRYVWSQKAFLNPDVVASQIQPVVVIDANVQQYGGTITDDLLYAAVEASIKKLQ